MPANPDKEFVLGSKLIVANTSGQANLEINKLAIGTTIVNTTAIGIGANVVLNQTDLRLGNSSVNAVVNSTSVIIANSSSSTKLAVPTPAEAQGNYFLHANGSWVNPSVTPAVGSANRVYQAFTASAGQVNFTVSGGFDTGSEDVFYNGAHLANTEFTDDGTTVTLTQPAQQGAIVEVIAWRGAVIVLTANGFDTEIQFNVDGSLGASGNLRFNYTTQKLTIGNTTANVTVNSNFIQIANSTVTGNLAVTGFSGGNTVATIVANTTYIGVSNSSGFANITPVSVNVGTGAIYTTIGSGGITQVGSNTLNLGSGSFTKAANGFTFLPNGVILQWGWVEANNAAGNITFPIVFPTAIYSYTATSSGGGSYGGNNYCTIIAANTSTMNVRTANLRQAEIATWFAIGS